jgi:hypothetical protein
MTRLKDEVEMGDSYVVAKATSSAYNTCVGKSHREKQTEEAHICP